MLRLWPRSQAATSLGYRVWFPSATKVPVAGMLATSHMHAFVKIL
jgi:hypothetical protein